MNAEGKARIALSERQARLVLNSLPDMGPITLNRLLEAVGGDPRAVLTAPPEAFAGVPRVSAGMRAVLREWQRHFDLEREEMRLAQAGATFVTAVEPDYPPLLREIHDPPIALYRKGPDTCQGPAIAIIGSRRTTLYGMAVAKRLGAELARAGFLIVSGLARGIDTAAHEGALEAEGRTAAVLGNGLDQVYPPENYDLYRRIAAKGALLTEFPFGRHADRQTFAMRNRIVAGLCAATIVVESDVDGGAMITARFAGEQGRVVGAVPGRIDQPTSRGCHQLIRDGALLVTEADDVLRELNYLSGMRPERGAPQSANAADASSEEPCMGEAALPPPGAFERDLLECLRGGDCLSIDALARKLDKPPSQVSASLMLLELRGQVAKRLDGTYETAG